MPRAALADAPREGRPPRANAAYHQALETVVETPPRTLGLPFDACTAARLSTYLAQETGVRIAPGGVRVLLSRRDFVCGRPKHTLKHLQDPEEVAACRQESAAAEENSDGRTGGYELHHEDETHVETNPYLSRGWHRRGRQATVPAAGTNRRLTVFGRVEALGRGRVELVCAGQDSACFERYLQALELRHQATKREVSLVLDNGPCHTSRARKAARAAWLQVIWLAQYSPELNPKEREWRRLKRDARGHLAPTLRAFVARLLEGLDQRGGERRDIEDLVPDWFLAGHRKEPTGRPAGRPKGAKDSYKRAPYRQKHHANLPAVA